MRRVLIEYTLRDDADVGEVEGRIHDFVSGIRGLDVGIHYTSHRRKEPAHTYAHLAIMPNEEALKALQAAPFFKSFAEFLRPKCADGPKTTTLDVVASTEASPG